MPIEWSAVLPPKLPYDGAMAGVLVKHDTSNSEYARRVYCVLNGYTLWEYENETEAKSGLWPKAEADVIGVSPAPAGSASLRSSMMYSTSSRPKDEAARTFVYTTTAGERVCAVALSEADKD